MASEEEEAGGRGIRERGGQTLFREAVRPSKARFPNAGPAKHCAASQNDTDVYAIGSQFSVPLFVAFYIHVLLVVPDN